MDSQDKAEGKVTLTKKVIKEEREKNKSQPGEILYGRIQKALQLAEC